MPRSCSLVGAVLVAALAVTLPHSAAAQTSTDTPTGAPSRNQCEATSQQVTASGSNLLLFLDGIRSGAMVWLRSWSAGVVVERALPVMSAPPLLEVWRKSAR